jgi:16S rRNA (guanine527-N7)-methyltransferase
MVTSRAVAPLGRLLDWSMPLVRQGGSLVAMKGSSAQQEVDASAAELQRHGAGAVEVLVLGAGQIDPPTTVVRVEATRPSRLGWDAAERERGQDGTRASGRRKGRRR